MTRRRQWVLVAALGAAAALLLGRAASALYVDYGWYAAAHATAVWQARVGNGVLLTGMIAAGAALFVFAHLYAVRRSIVTVVLPRRVGNVDIGQAIPGRHLTAATAALSLAIGIGLALPPEPWTELALARYGIPFGETEPYFQNDLGFFVYWLPLETALYVRALVTVLVTTCLVILLYFALTPSLRWERSRLSISPHVRRHAAVCTACIFAVLAWSYRLDAYGLLGHGSGPSGAFAHVDHYLGIAANQALAVLTVAAGLVTALALWRAQLRTALALVTLTIVIPIVVFHGLPPLLARGDPSTLSRREEPYAAIRAVATRRAYGVDFPSIPDPRVTSPARFASLADAAPGIALWDPAALALALQRKRTGGVVSTAMGSRWSPPGLLTLAVGWAGAGSGGGESDTLAAAGPTGGVLTRIRATMVDDRGWPLQADSLGRSTSDDAAIPPVLVYEGATGPMIVSDSLGRIVAPTIGGALQRLAHALSEQHLSLLTADLPEPNPKVVVRRDVRARVAALVPFFAQGTTVAPVVMADSVYWVVELYSASDTYPLSAHFILAREERSYFQHAARAFVNAATGRVLLVTDEPLDPIAATWVRRFPRLFVHTAATPPELSVQVPPAIDQATAVGHAFAEAGGRGDPPPSASTRQHVVVADGADTALAGGELPCILASGPATDASRPCIWTVPLVNGGGRLSGLIVARGGGLPRVSWYRLDPPGPRWTMVLDRLARAADADTAVRRDAPVARGRVRTIVTGDTCTFVQPVYAWRADAPPALTRVDVATDDSAWTVPPPLLLDVAAARGGRGGGVGGSGTADTSGHANGAGGTGLTPAAFRARTRVLYDAMQDALRRGDLAAFGVAYRALGDIINGGEKRP